MTKALHDYFYINTGKEIKLYSKDDVAMLLEAANMHIDRINGKKVSNMVPELEAFFYKYTNEYYEKGVTDNLLSNLTEILAPIKVQCLTENINNRLSAVYIANIPFNSHPKYFGAYMFFGIASLGGLEGLKKCQNKSCSKFLIGRSNVKWCSKSCGSKHRVTKMRRNKQ